MMFLFVGSIRVASRRLVRSLRDELPQLILHIGVPLLMMEREPLAARHLCVWKYFLMRTSRVFCSPNDLAAEGSSRRKPHDVMTPGRARSSSMRFSLATSSSEQPLIFVPPLEALLRSCDLEGHQLH